MRQYDALQEIISQQGACVRGTCALHYTPTLSIPLPTLSTIFPTSHALSHPPSQDANRYTATSRAVYFILLGGIALIINAVVTSSAPLPPLCFYGITFSPPTVLISARNAMLSEHACDVLCNSMRCHVIACDVLCNSM